MEEINPMDLCAQILGNHWDKIPEEVWAFCVLLRKEYTTASKTGGREILDSNGRVVGELSEYAHFFYQREQAEEFLRAHSAKDLLYVSSFVMFYPDDTEKRVTPSKETDI